jgi:glycosyltransferase involved in cell wall biosynthesis
MNRKYPTISVVIATYNSGRTLDACLKSIREQDYLQKNIEILLGDGGSTDSTRGIAKKYSAKIIAIPREKQKSEFNRGTAFNKATGEYVLILDHDNFLPSTTWLQDMTRPLLENKDVTAVETCYYHYDRSYSAIDRYFALFGTSEPIPYYLKKADRMMQTSKSWNLAGKAKDKGKYFLVTFDKDPRKFPTIGSNGCLMRRETLFTYADIRPDHHYPIDVFVDVLEKGFRTYAFVKNSIIHRTGYRGFWQFMDRRKKFVEKYYFEEEKNRRYSVFMKGDEVRLALFVLYSVTVVKPLYDALRGYIRIRDKAWFLHPFMCMGTTILYGYVFIKFRFFKRI